MRFPFSVHFYWLKQSDGMIIYSSVKTKHHFTDGNKDFMHPRIGEIFWDSWQLGPLHYFWQNGPQSKTLDNEGPLWELKQLNAFPIFVTTWVLFMICENVGPFVCENLMWGHFFDVSEIVLSKVSDHFGVVLMCETTRHSNICKNLSPSNICCNLGPFWDSWKIGES